MTTKFNQQFYGTFRGARVRSRGRLPHIEADDAYYSITYRLDDALPQSRVLELKSERDNLLRQLERDGASAIERSAALEILERRYDTYLDEGYGSCVLRDPRAAALIEENLKFHDGRRYDLGRWSVMPNHVHVTMLLHKGADLAAVLHSWKSYTSNRINEAVGRRGRLWEVEYWDRLIRDEADLIRTSRYVYENPEAAGFKNWPWRG
jgi:REP element-mobilizing transposase RayT